MFRYKSFSLILCGNVVRYDPDPQQYLAIKNTSPKNSLQNFLQLCSCFLNFLDSLFSSVMFLINSIPIILGSSSEILIIVK